jgi:hypothetical protein
MQPQQSTWVQTATVSWIRKNKATDIDSYMDVPNKISDEEDREKKADDLIEVLQDEHNRVHMEDQKLINSFNKASFIKPGTSQS